MRNVHTLSRLSSTSQYGMHAGPPAYANTAPGAPSRHVTGSRAGFGSLTAGMHVRSLVESSASVVTLGVPAVPEPETYALMLASLGAMVFVARRRNAR